VKACADAVTARNFSYKI